MEIRKSIMIIKASNRSSVSIETFLRNRDWVLYSTTNLKEALSYLIQSKPSFVLVAVDHPVKKVRTLPKLLIQSFDCCVIAYTEGTTTQAYKYLMDSGCDYRINPPLTGPAVERTINKYIKDLETHGRQKPAPATIAKKETSNTIVMKGQAHQPGGAINFQQPREGASEKDQPAAIINQVSDDNLDIESFIANSLASNQGTAASANPQARGAPLGAPLGAPVQTPSEDPHSFAGIVPGDQNTSEAQSAGAPLMSVDPQTGELRANVEAPALMANNPETQSANAQPSSIGYFPDQQNQSHQPGAPYLPNQNSSGLAPNGASSEQAQQAAPLGAFYPDQQQNPSAAPGYFPDQPQEQQKNPASLGYSPDDPRSQNSEEEKPASNLRGKLGSEIYQNLKDDEGLPLKSENAPKGEIFGHNTKAKAPINQGHVPVYREDDFDSKEAEAKKAEAPRLNIETGKAEEIKPTYEEGEDKKKKVRETLNKTIHRVGGKHQGWEKNDSIIGRGTQQALDDSVANKDEDIKQVVEESSNVACIVVESPRFSGYLVAAMGKNRKIDKGFVTSIRDRLFKFLKENGEESREEENMEIKIKQVDFQDWALEYADFLRRSVHNGDEVAMAFFPFAEATTSMGNSASAEMGSVKIDDLHGDLQIEFNLYIYLPANNRYVLYTPKGSKFYSNQKNRLQGMGVTHLHMRKSEAQDLSKYRAQNYLNSKIEEYERKKATKKKSA